MSHLHSSGRCDSAVAIPIAVQPAVVGGMNSGRHPAEGSLDELSGLLHTAAEITHHIEGGVRGEVPALPETVEHFRAPLHHLRQWWVRHSVSAGSKHIIVMPHRNLPAANLHPYCVIGPRICILPTSVFLGQTDADNLYVDLTLVYYVYVGKVKNC